MVCSTCGRELDKVTRFCAICGRGQSTQLGIAVPDEDGGCELLSEIARPLPWRQAFEIMLATCRAVAEARARGATALSLEPESFFVERQHSRWVVTILDADVWQGPRDTAVMSAPFLTLPRIDYFPPERLLDKPLDSRSDVYTLGVIAYELLTGTLPFEDARAEGLTLIDAMLKRAPQSPAERRPEARIPSEAADVILRCLHAKRDPRHADAGKLADELAAIIGRRQVRPLLPPKPVASAASPITIIHGNPCGGERCKTPHLFQPSPNGTVVGNWLFFDHFDSAISLRPNAKPHPHVGMVVVTYLFEGRIVHRDQLGNDQLVTPNTLSWFYAGRGMVHTDHQHEVDRAAGNRLHGLELWLALPKPNETDLPAYAFHRASELPSIVISGARIRVVIGDGFGVTSPIETPTLLSMFDIRVPPRAALALPAPPIATYLRALYVVSGSIEVLGSTIAARELAVLSPSAVAGISAGDAPAHVVMLGSPPVIGPRYTWWYFSASSQARLDSAQRSYVAGDFGDLPDSSKH